MSMSIRSTPIGGETIGTLFRDEQRILDTQIACPNQDLSARASGKDAVAIRFLTSRLGIASARAVKMSLSRTSLTENWVRHR